MGRGDGKRGSLIYTEKWILAKESGPSAGSGPRKEGPKPKENRTMRNTMAFLGAAALTLAGVGWYLGWYDVLIKPSAAGHQNVDIDVNIPKIKDDINKGEEKGKKKLQEALDNHNRKASGVDDGSSEAR
jgi:hypothetical protein